MQIECDICNEFAQIAWDNSEKLDEMGIEAVWRSAAFYICCHTFGGLPTGE